MLTRKQLRTLHILDITAVTAVLATFTAGLMNQRYFFYDFVNAWKWGVLGLFALYSVFRNLRNLRIANGLSTLLFLALPVVGAASTLTQLRNAEEGVQWIIGFASLFTIAVIVPVPPNARQRLELWAKSFMYVDGAIIWFSLALANDPSKYGGGRFLGCMGHVNFLAASASIFCVAMTGYLLLGSKKWRLFALVNLGAGLFCLVTSGGRADMAATFVAVVIMIFRVVNRKNALILIATVVLISVPVLFAREIIETFSPSRLAQRNFSIGDRTDIWSRQLEVFVRSPLIGWGFEMHDLTGLGRAGGEGSYFDLLSAAGILGAGPFFLAIFIGIFQYNKFLSYSLRSSLNQRHPDQIHLVNGFGMIICLLVTSMAEEWLGTVGTPLAIFGWISIAAATGLRPPRHFPATRYDSSSSGVFDSARPFNRLSVEQIAR